MTSWYTAAKRGAYYSETIVVPVAFEFHQWENASRCQIENKHFCVVFAYSKIQRNHIVVKRWIAPESVLSLSVGKFFELEKGWGSQKATRCDDIFIRRIFEVIEIDFHAKRGGSEDASASKVKSAGICKLIAGYELQI